MKKKGASNIKVSVILSYLLVVSVMITGLIALYNNLVDFSNKKVRKIYKRIPGHCSILALSISKILSLLMRSLSGPATKRNIAPDSNIKMPM
jgi:hypothetical protein